MAAIAQRLRYEVLESRRLAATDLASSLSFAVDSNGIEGLRAAEIQVRYDPHKMTLEEVDIQAGNVWKGGASVVSRIDEVVGSVNIFLFSAQPIKSDYGDLVELKFDISDDLAADVSFAEITKLRLNEGAIEAAAQLRTHSALTVPTSGLVDHSRDTIRSAIAIAGVLDPVTKNVPLAERQQPTLSSESLPASESTSLNVCVPLVKQLAASPAVPIDSEQSSTTPTEQAALELRTIQTDQNLRFRFAAPPIELKYAWIADRDDLTTPSD